LDFFLVKDSPGLAGLEDFDAGDATASSEMDKEYTTLELFKKIII